MKIAKKRCKARTQQEQQQEQQEQTFHQVVGTPQEPQHMLQPENNRIDGLPASFLFSRNYLNVNTP